jgi:hypothetical protein
MKCYFSGKPVVQVPTLAPEGNSNSIYFRWVKSRCKKISDNATNTTAQLSLRLQKKPQDPISILKFTQRMTPGMSCTIFQAAGFSAPKPLKPWGLI